MKINVEKDDFINLDTRESLYLKLINSENTTGITPNFDELEKIDCIAFIKEADNALKEIDNNRIIGHKNRDEYEKVTYPLYLKTDTFINFLKKERQTEVIETEIPTFSIQQAQEMFLISPAYGLIHVSQFRKKKFETKKSDSLREQFLDHLRNQL